MIYEALQNYLKETRKNENILPMYPFTHMQ